MSQWIITPDKFLSEEEVKRLRKACEESSIIAKSKGNQIATIGIYDSFLLLLKPYSASIK